MYVRNSKKYNKEIRVIHPGEYYVSAVDEIIGTLLGSCIAVCLYDRENMVGGMNHFMLPGRISEVDIFKDRSARYGITAINELIESMVKNGGQKKNFTAKIFGGGHVLSALDKGPSIPDDNIRLARIMMELEDIEIIDSDVGSNFTRKVLFDVKSGSVYLKKTTRDDINKTVAERESVFARRNFRNGKNKSNDNR